MKRLFVIVMTAAMISGAALAAPSWLGITGNILTPDDIVLSPGDFSANLHSFQDNNNPVVIAAAMGVTDGLELGLGSFDPDVAGIGKSTFVNAKYSVLMETQSRPSLVIGATDLTGELDPDGDPGFFVLFGKNLTPVATDIAGEPSAPLRGMLGYGTGIYNGFFASLDWTLTPKVSVMAELISEANIAEIASNESMINAGIRLAITSELRVDAALIDGQDLAFGISYTRIGLD